MTLEDAIVYYSETAKECRRKARIESNDYMDMKDCAYEAEQLSDWLNELKILRERIDVRKKDEWIPCSERLPEKGNEVLVCYDFKGHRSVLIGTLYGDGKFYGYDDEYLTPEGRKYRKAVAWMPLPEPYKEDEHVNDKS